MNHLSVKFDTFLLCIQNFNHEECMKLFPESFNSPGWGNHIKGNHDFSTQFQHLLFLNQVTIWTGSFFNF